MKSNRLIPNLALFTTFMSVAVCLSHVLWAVIAPSEFTFHHFLTMCGSFAIFSGALVITLESEK